MRWGTIAAATRGSEKMQEAVRHSMNLELLRTGGVEARQVHERAYRDDFWHKNSEILHVSEDTNVERKWHQGFECHSDECREDALKHSSFEGPQRAPFWRARVSAAKRCFEQNRCESRLLPGEDLDGTIFSGIHGAYGGLLAQVQQRFAFLSELPW